MNIRLHFTLLFIGTILSSCDGRVSATWVHRTEISKEATPVGSTQTQWLTPSPTPTVTKSSVDNPCAEGMPGEWILFTSTRDDPQPFECSACNSDIYAVDATGTSIVRLSFDPAEDRNPVWSPDGMRIAFASTRDAGKSQIFVMDCDGSDVIQLTKGPNAAAHPAWSADGQRIAYIQTDYTAECDPSIYCPQDIYSMNLNGSHLIRMTNTETNKSGLAWSPDGKSMLYASYVEGKMRDGVILYLFSFDGADAQPLTSEFGWVFSFDYSPEGKRIAFDNYQ
jgi:TolB protein